MRKLAGSESVLRCPRRWREVWKARDGLSTIEVLVALSILSLGLGVASNLLTRGQLTHQHAQLRLQQIQLADRVLAELRLAPEAQFQTDKPRQHPLAPGLKYRVRAISSAALPQDLRLVEVEVTEAKGTTTHRLRGVVSIAQPNGSALPPAIGTAPLAPSTPVAPADSPEAVPPISAGSVTPAAQANPAITPVALQTPAAEPTSPATPAAEPIPLATPAAEPSSAADQPGEAQTLPTPAPVSTASGDAAAEGSAVPASTPPPDSSSPPASVTPGDAHATP